MADRCDSVEPVAKLLRCDRAAGHDGFHIAGLAESAVGMSAWGEGVPGPVVEAELITAAVGDFQARNPGAVVESVEVVELASITQRNLVCDRCGAEIPVAFFLRLCDACVERLSL